MTWWEIIGISFVIFVGLVILIAGITVAYNNWDYIMLGINKQKRRREKIEDYSEIIFVCVLTTFVAGLFLGYFIWGV